MPPLVALAEVHVATEVALRDAVAAVAPGDVIVIDAGVIRLTDTLRLDVPGTPQAPIVLRGAGATLESDTVEALKLSAPWWVVEDLVLRGVCGNDDTCEHALHIVGAADGTVVRNNVLVDFNAQIKANGEDAGGGMEWPDDVWIVANDFHDTRARQTANPVTKLDVVGGRRWVVEANRFADFQKALGDGVSYAAFLKGNSRDGLLERNLVVCSDTFDGGTRVGLSLGGGGTSPDSICEEGSCTPEHQRGILRNNIVQNCVDVGIYLNEASETRVLHNTLYATAGIDVRFEDSTAEVAGNVLDGDIRERDGGTAVVGTNYTGDLAAVFAAPDEGDFDLRDDPGLIDAGAPDPDVPDDYCAHPRDARPDLGAIEYATPCGGAPVPPASAPVDTAQPSAAPSPSATCAGCAAATGPGNASWFAALALAIRIRGARNASCRRPDRPARPPGAHR